MILTLSNNSSMTIAILKRFNIIFVNNKNILWVHHIDIQCYNRFRIIERWQHAIKLICCPWESEPCILCSSFNLNMIPLQICRLLPSRFNRKKEEDSHFMFEDGSQHFIQQLKLRVLFSNSRWINYILSNWI